MMSVPRTAEMPVPAPSTPRGHKRRAWVPPLPNFFYKGFPLKRIRRRGEPPDTAKARRGGDVERGEKPG